VAGELFVRDVSGLDDDEDLFGLERDGRRRPLLASEHLALDIHASREARWHPLDVAGARSIVVFSVLKRVLRHGGFSSHLVWARPDRRRGVFRTPPPSGCKLERPQTLGVRELVELGLDRPESEPLMGRWTGSPCHAALIDPSRASEPWVHGWDAEHPALVAQLFVEWEVLGEESVGEESDSFVDLRCALHSCGPRAIVMYLLGSRYSELLPAVVEGLQRAKRHVKRIDAALSRLRPGAPSPPALAPIAEAFEAALREDLDTPSAFLALFDWIREAKTARAGTVGDEQLRKMLWLIGMAGAPGTTGGGLDGPALSAPARRRTA
jgi:hypothetical protein